ncbi:hypothetical protein LJ737_07170 [Hymenobacter sp. 15J16-1T3B]|uniref:hypothetical protein n=1 Tax=Hymenobacter sp. 15J16-1T3B TaxID=2886941 RepID=UPI001D103434|nr:hypothetical protein [Hymenobacter sp. 15J16-1T3B]MCC3157012.1 hypothetical protein [Hymenobacter sp. 15J16-1T3B]
MLIHRLRYTGLWSLLLGLGACQQSDSHSAAASEAPAAKMATAPAAAPGAPAATQDAAAPAGPFTGTHRYVGTVGTAPVVLTLTITPPGPEAPQGRLDGVYYYERQGQPLILSVGKNYRPGQPLVLEEGAPKPDAPDETVPTGRWQATQPLGPELSGTWLSPDGRRRKPFHLREDYTGAVRYELLREEAHGATCPPGPEEEGGGPRRPEVSRTVLHLLGPDTLQPALRALQCPLPEQRRSQLAVELDQADCEGTFGFYGDVQVALNGYGLLSVQHSEGEYAGGAYPNSANELATYDLRTGRLLKRTAWLRAGREPALSRLLLRRLRMHPYASSLGLNEPGGPAYLPELGFDSEGAYCLLGDFGAPHAVQGVPVVIPYRELRPLVQPGSALARMLQQRGLW